MTTRVVLPQPPPWFNVSATGEIGLNYTHSPFNPGKAVKMGHTMFAVFDRNNTWDVYDSDYVTSIIIYAAVFLGIGVVFFITLPIVYLSISKCRGCCGQIRSEQLLKSRLRFVFVASSVMGMIGVILSLTGTILVSFTLTEAQSDLKSFASVANNADYYARQAIFAANRTVIVVEPLSMSVITCPVVPASVKKDVKAMVSDVTSTGQKYIELVEKNINSVNAPALADAFDTIAGHIDDSQPARIAFIVVLFVVEATLMAIFMGLGYLRFSGRKPREAGLREASLKAGCVGAPLAGIVVLLSWLLFALSIATAMFVGDFCVDADYNAQLAVRHQSRSAANLLAFYQRCQGAELPSDQVAEGQALIQQSIARVNSTVAPITQEALSVACPENVPDFNKYSYELWDALQAAWDAGVALREQLSCSKLSGLYTSAVEDTTCTELPANIFVMMFGGLCTALFLSTTVICWRLLLDQRAAEQRASLLLSGPGSDAGAGNTGKDILDETSGETGGETGGEKGHRVLDTHEEYKAPMPDAPPFEPAPPG